MREVFKLFHFLIFALLFICNMSLAEVSVKNSNYDVVDSKGIQVNESGANMKKGIFFARTSSNKTSSQFHLSYFDKLASQHNFDFSVNEDSLLSTPNGDYFVVESMRSIAFNREEDRDYWKHPEWWPHKCGHAVNLSFLVAVINKKINIVKKEFTQCNSEVRTFNRNGQIGYEIKGYSKNKNEPLSVLYLLQNGVFIRKENGPYKEEQ